MTNASELRELNDAELVQKLAEAREEHFNLRFQSATGQLDNSSRIGDIRREVARINTLLREREIAAAEQQEA
jgi:large subunit ribosomal protein L29